MGVVGSSNKKTLDKLNPINLQHFKGREKTKQNVSLKYFYNVST